MKTLSLLVRCVGALCALALPGVAAAQAPGASYAWYGEVVSFDAASKAATVRLLAQKPVGSQIGDLKAGEKVVLVWQPMGNEADRLVYIGRESAMAAIDLGYILRAEFVSADMAAETVTVKTAVPDSAAAALQGATGKWVKATMPKDQSGGKSAVTTVALSAKPDLKPPASTAKAETAANPTGPLSNVAGEWEFETSLAGNTVTNLCGLKQDGTKISGECKGLAGTAPMSDAVVAGNTIKFSVKVSFSGMPLEFVYAGVVEPDGTSIAGMVTVFGTGAAFTGTKH